MSEDKDVANLLEVTKDHAPWLEAPDIWPTEAKYFMWLRGELRRLWTHYPVRNQFKESLVTYKPVMDKKTGKQSLFKSGKKKGKKRWKSEINCSLCHKTFSKSAIEMDHLESAGSCSTHIEAAVFLHKLLCPATLMRPVCKICHKTHTYAEKHGLSMEEAKRTKAVILWQKENNALQQKEELLGCGFSEAEIKTGALRRASYLKHLENNND